ncbi:methylated-DNA--[protein]-cysteine S-methyltransferase [SAR202 cluster bacterium AC-409-J13_OGT_754m]|nr:methylated-DNA--[protein]-cysteine S-methyltransferase [SAR202 cluster bacterium AC-409-J13_OGT_754m]
MLFYDVFSTPLGWFGILLSNHGVRRSSLGPTKGDAIQRIGTEIQNASQSNSKLVRTIREIVHAYFTGTGFALDQLPLDMQGMSPFARDCLMVCRSIPVGETRSYLWIATELKRPKAARAVGGIMARNRLPVVIPYHRVIANSGQLHGYSGGLTLKRKLLTLEQSSN